MTVEQVLQLVDKGFSRDDIMKLTETNSQKPQPKPEPKQEPQQKPEPQPKPEPKQEPQQKPEPQPKPEPKQEPNQINNRLDSIEESIKKLLKTIQVSNIKTDSFGKTGESLEEQTDKIMASIIRPEKEG